jgi:hypothetical protein
LVKKTGKNLRSFKLNLINLSLDMKQLLVPFLFMVMFTYKVVAQTTIPAKDAAKHIGETVRICDKIFSGKVTTSNTTLLYFAGNYPKQAFAVIINSVDRSKFKDRPEIDYAGKDFTVTGKLVNYEGKPGIIVNDPGHLKVVMIDNTHPVMLQQAKPQ